MEATFQPHFMIIAYSGKFQSGGIINILTDLNGRGWGTFSCQHILCTCSREGKKCSANVPAESDFGLLDKDKQRSKPLLERVEKFDTLLDGNAARSKIKDFRTALYPRQYHPSVLEKPLYSAVFRLQGVFPPRMSAEKQKMQHNRRKSRL